MAPSYSDLVWVIEDTRFDECHSPQDIAAEVERQGMAAHVVKYNPMGGWDDQDFPSYPMQQPVLFVGTLNMARLVRRHAHHAPAVYCDPKKYECTTYYPSFGEWLLNGDYAMIPFGDAVRSLPWLAERFGRDGCLFVRPNSGMKTLSTGKVIQIAQFYDELNKLARYQKPEKIESELIVVSSPKLIADEYRFIVANREVIAYSRYKPAVDECVPLEAISSAKMIALRAPKVPESLWVLDLARTPGEDMLGDPCLMYSVIEINSFSCSGWYACNLHDIVRRASEVALLDNAQNVTMWLE